MADVGDVRRFSGVVDDSRYKPSCSARAADGFIRGGLVGLAWGAAFHPLDELAVTGWTSAASKSTAETASQSATEAEVAAAQASKPSGSTSSASSASSTSASSAKPPNPSTSSVPNSASSASTSAAKPQQVFSTRPKNASMSTRDLRKSQSVAHDLGSRKTLASFWREKAFPRLRSMGQASLMFGCFLGTFGGMTCVSEDLTHSKHSFNVFVGGASAGGLLAIRQGSPRTVLLTALGTGSLTAALHTLVKV
mmetsp:Transcript_8292/g.16514  ORF Transcript_8292/g.16514 Transcript_8292/m.16514 type:complete len:251 (+) Transcript_8292:158-910(+)